MPTSSEILVSISTKLSQLITKVDALDAKVTAISASGTSPKDAIEQAIKDLVNG